MAHPPWRGSPFRRQPDSGVLPPLLACAALPQENFYKLGGHEERGLPPEERPEGWQPEGRRRYDPPEQERATWEQRDAEQQALAAQAEADARERRAAEWQRQQQQAAAAAAAAAAGAVQQQ